MIASVLRRVFPPHHPVRVLYGDARGFILAEREKIGFLRRLDRAEGPKALAGRLGSTPQGDYLISTDRGVFRANAEGLSEVFPFYTFGLCAGDGGLFLAVAIQGVSYLIRAPLADALGRGTSWTLLHQAETLYHNERIHQIAHDGTQGRLLVAHTKRNAIMTVDLGGEGRITEVFPFSDQFGGVISIDQHHVNSVHALSGGRFLFSAHSGIYRSQNEDGNASIIGLVSGGRVRGYAFPRRGVHDVIPARSGIAFSDTFGSSAGGEAHVGGRILPRPTGIEFPVTRGIAGSGREVVVGNSFPGSRAQRFGGQGGLVVYDGDEQTGFVPLPCSQVYDVIRADGGKLDDADPTMGDQELCARLAADVGPLVLDGPVIVTESRKAE